MGRETAMSEICPWARRHGGRAPQLPWEEQRVYPDFPFRPDMKNKIFCGDQGAILERAAEL
jgi:hypothetical protein